MDSCLRQFVLVEGQGANQVRACAERLRTEGGFEAHELEVINHLEQVALLIAERYLPLIPTRGQVGTELEFQILGEELETLGRSWPEDYVPRLYALHNAATCFAQVNGDVPDEQLRLNREVVTVFQNRGIEIFNDAAQGLLLRKVLAGLYEANHIPVDAGYSQVVNVMVRFEDPDACGRVEFLLRLYRDEGKHDSVRALIREARTLFEKGDRVKPAQLDRLQSYLMSGG